MFTDDQLKIAETFLGTAVNSGVLDATVCKEMVNRIKRHEEVLLTYAIVEKRLGVSRMTVYRMINNGTLEGVKFRGNARITKSSLERLILETVENKA